jgi:hypothetical protein
MSIKNYELIEKMKLTAMRRCEERIENAAREGRDRKDRGTPQFGVSALLKSRHGL